MTAGSKIVQKGRNDEPDGTPPPSRSRNNSTVPLPPLEKLNADLPDLPVLPAKILVPPVRTATGSRPPVGALPKTPVKEKIVAAKKPTTSPGHKRRGMIGSHSTTDLVAIPPMPTPIRPSARPVNDPPRVTAPIARSTEGAPLAMAPIHRFKSAEKLQALIMALHDSTEFTRPDGSFSSTFNAADRLMQDLPQIPTPVLPSPAPSPALAVAKPSTPAPASSAAPTVFAMPARQSVNTRVLPPTIITNAISPPLATAGAVLAKASAVAVSAAPQSVADSPDSSQTIAKPEIPSPSDVANSAAASTAINPHAATATLAAPAVVAAAVSVPTSPSAPSPVPRSMYADSPLVASLDPHFAPRAQRIAVLTKVVDIVRHGIALHQRLVSEEEGDTAATTSSRGPTTAASAATVTNLAALTKARRKALDEYRVSVEDLGRRTRDYIRSLPVDMDATGAGGPCGGFGAELTSPNAQAIDLVESVEIMLMKLAQLREVFADRV
ncbi:hypothetical protein BDZ88DRAFT_404492 [Geranomyces variabilis]|nr:hypothetical protein BDZ88DRAFT_404492 [Geranomyces variabilis]KAJ3143491.1 hypothetical protein HDU90_000252 [Geranomyces variabilis]